MPYDTGIGLGTALGTNAASRRNQARTKFRSSLANIRKEMFPQTVAPTSQQSMHDRIMAGQDQALRDAQARTQHAIAMQSGSLAQLPIPGAGKAYHTAGPGFPTGSVRLPGGGIRMSGSSAGVGLREARLAREAREASEAPTAPGLAERLEPPESVAARSARTGLRVSHTGSPSTRSVMASDKAARGLASAMGITDTGPLTSRAAYGEELARRKEAVKARGISKGKARTGRLEMRGLVREGVAPGLAAAIVGGGGGEMADFARLAAMVGPERAAKVMTERARIAAAREESALESGAASGDLETRLSAIASEGALDRSSRGDIADADREGLIERLRIQEKIADQENELAQQRLGIESLAATGMTPEQAMSRTPEQMAMGTAARDPQSGAVSPEFIRTFLDNLPDGTSPEEAMQMAMAAGITRSDLQEYWSSNPQPSLLDRLTPHMQPPKEGETGFHNTSILEDVLRLLGRSGKRGFATAPTHLGTGARRRIAGHERRDGLLEAILGQ